MTTGGQRPYVILYRPDQSLLGTVYLPDIIGTIAPNTWYQVSIPLTAHDQSLILLLTIARVGYVRW